MGDEYLLLCEDYTTDTVGEARHRFAVEFPDVLVAVWAEDFGAVLVQAEVERRSVLDYRFVE